MDLETIRRQWILAPGNVSAEAAAWDSEAENYLFEEKNNFEDDPFLRFIAEKAALTSEMRTLDVGCGAGAYSVAMAQRVGQADGVDLSPRMVNLGNAYAREHAITNLRLWVENWHTCDIAPLRKQYDLVFAHTTPAVADFTTLVKLCEASRGCCFLCKPARRSDQVFDEIRRLAGLPVRHDIDDSVAFTFDTLWGLGYDPEVRYAKTQWLPERTLEEAERWYIGRIRGQNLLDEETEHRIRGFLREISINGIVKERIDTTLVNICWHVEK